jgi:hypothetical protein
VGQLPEPIELEAGDNLPQPVADKRPLVPEPLPVRLLTVDDATLLTSAGLEIPLDDFYEGLLRFQREPVHPPIYYADNFRLIFQVVECLPERDSCRPLLIEVPKLSEIELGLIERKIEYVRLRGIALGDQRLTLQDPAGNWVEIVEYRRI